MKKIILLCLLTGLVYIEGIAQRVTIGFFPPTTVNSDGSTGSGGSTGSAGSSARVSSKMSFDFDLLTQGFSEDLETLRLKYANTQGSASNSWTPSPGNPATATFIEFGDGTFSFKASGTHTYSGTKLNYHIVTKATGIYDEGTRPPPPPRHALADASVASSGFTVTGNNELIDRDPPETTLLPKGSLVKITPNINSLVPGDTMIFVATYKLPKGMAGSSSPKLRFHYNNIDAFIPLAATTGVIFDGAMWVPAVRSYNEEAAYYIASPKDGFAKAIEFPINSKDTIEHNIFITLVPKPKFPFDKLTEAKSVKVFAELSGIEMSKKDGNSTGPESAAPTMTDQLDMPAFATSHDPNYVIITPGCNAFPKAGKLLTFYVHCQNEGVGPATQVKMAVKLPGGIDVNYFRQYARTDSKTPYKSKVTWSWPAPDSVVILFEPVIGDGRPDYILSGASQDNPYDPNTMAEAWFTIPANERMHNLVMSAANIYFRNMPRTGLNENQNWNPPVTTNPGIARFSDCCDCKKKKDCGCKKTKKKLWRWLFCKKC